MSQKYYPLHVHTSVGSVGDSVLGIKEYVQKGLEYGLDALAVTDHGSMSAMFALADECLANNIKPIIGMEAYIVDDNSKKDKEHGKGAAGHLLLLARTDDGLKNLLSLHNQAATEGFYYEPRTDYEHIKKYGKGIIAFSACVGGEIPQAIINDDLNKAKEIAAYYNDCFDEFYFEIQPGSFPEQTKVNQELVKMSREMNIPLVVTNDIHYLTASDAQLHDYHVKLGRHSSAEGMIYPDACYWFMDAEALKQAFTYNDAVTPEVVEEAIKTTEAIAHKCNVNMKHEGHYMPAYPVSEGETEDEVLARMCFTRLNSMIENKPNPQDYVDRLNYELNVIKEKGFSGYFLIVQDYVNWARRHNIAVGPGRGSAAGSLVANVLGISQPDPIKYNLLFERFLDPHREKIPDIDVDFEPGENGRDRMFRYAVKRYGYEHCALVSTLGIRHAKGAVRDAARILGYPPAVGNDIAKLIPDVYYGDDDEKKTDLDIKTSIQVVPQLQKMYESYQDVLDLASQLEGLPSSTGIHAAGIIISPVALTSMVPLIRPNKEGVLATSLNLDDAERLLVKFDYLSLGTLSVIKSTENDAHWHFNTQDESLFHDDKVWDLIGSRNTTGVFQIASRIYKDRMPRLKPRSIEELAACLALVRGPSISSKTDELYMQILEGKKQIEHIHPLYDEITKTTNGIIIYQEQVMHLAVAFGMDLSTGYRIVKLSAKKKMDKLEEYRQQFVSLAKSHDCDSITANRIFDMIVKSGEYSFNKSHAVSYAFITYISAYLKVHYPMEFEKNLLTYAYEKGKDKEYASILQDCRNLGIQFLPADVNHSSWEFTIEHGKIRVGLCAVKGLGDKASDIIVKNRAEAPYTSLEGFINSFQDGDARVFNKKVMTVAIFSGMMDDFRAVDQGRVELFRTYLDLRGKKEEVPEEIKLGAKNFTIHPESDTPSMLETIFFGGSSFIYTPVNTLESVGWNNIRIHNQFEIDAFISKVKKVKARDGQMAFIDMMTGDGIIHGTVFNSTWMKIRKGVKANQMARFWGRKENADSCILSDIAVGNPTEN